MGFFNFFSKEKKETLDKGLEKTKQGLFDKLKRAVAGRSKIDDDFLDNLEEVFITSDVGVETTLKIIDRLQKRAARDKYVSTSELNTLLRDEITEMLAENNNADTPDFSVPSDKKPYVIMVVGVNGVGKTTTIGKLAYQFKKAGNKLEIMKAQYSKVEANVDKIAQNLENHQITLLKDVAMFDQMYELNLKYYKELTMYILAGKKRLAEVRATEVEELRKKAEQTGLAEDAQAYNDLVSLCDRFEKKLHDLELTRMVSIQMGPQTRLLQNNDTQMIEKIQSSLVNTIPLWKSQMVLALGLEHSRQATAAQNAVTEMTNQLLKKNADTLKMGTIATAKEAERSIVDIETLQHTNQQLISTLDEVARIQKEGAAKRKEAEVELGRIEGELKQKLLELRS